MAVLEIAPCLNQNALAVDIFRVHKVFGYTSRQQSHRLLQWRKDRDADRMQTALRFYL